MKSLARSCVILLLVSGTSCVRSRTEKPPPAIESQAEVEPAKPPLAIESQMEGEPAKPPPPAEGAPVAGGAPGEDQGITVAGGSAVEEGTVAGPAPELAPASEPAPEPQPVPTPPDLPQPPPQPVPPPPGIVTTFPKPSPTKILSVWDLMKRPLVPTLQPKTLKTPLPGALIPAIPSPPPAPTPSEADVFDRFFGLSCEALKALNVVSIRCLGSNSAKGDGVADDTNSFQMKDLWSGPSAYTESASRNWHNIILVPPGIYAVSRCLTLVGAKLIGPSASLGIGQATIKVIDTVGKIAPCEHICIRWKGETECGQYGDVSAVIYTGNPTILQNLTIDANHKAETGLYSYKAHGPGIFRDIKVARAGLAVQPDKPLKGAGFHFDYCQTGRFERLVSEDNYGPGFLIDSANGSLFIGLDSRKNQGSGIVATGTLPTEIVGFNSANASGGFYLDGGTIEDNAGNGIDMQDVTASSILENLAIRNNGGDGILINSIGEHNGTNNIKILNNVIEDTEPNGSVAIRLKPGTGSCLIEGNRAPIQSDNDYASIVIEEGSRGNYVIGNRDSLGETYRPLPVTFTDRNTVVPFDMERFSRSPVFFGGQTSPVPALRGTASANMAPGPGKWQKGDVILNSNPNKTDTAPGWVCGGLVNGTCQWESLNASKLVEGTP